MQLDRAALEKLLNMNDAQLKYVITKLATEAGLDLSSFNISANDINSVRRALSGATDEDIARAAEQMRQRRRGGR